MSLLDHAETELRTAGLFDKDSDYDGMIGDAVKDLVRVFADQGHSGYSAALTLDVFQRVASYKALGPITNNPDEWMHVDADMAGNATTWQNRRQPDLFSYDVGETWYSVDDPRWHRRLRGWRFRRRINRLRSARDRSS